MRNPLAWSHAGLAALVLASCNGAAPPSSAAVAALTGSGSIAFVPTIAALRAGGSGGASAVDVCGYHTCGDGGGGRFVPVPLAGQGCADNGGSIIAASDGSCLYRVTSSFGPREWGAWGDGTCHDAGCDTVALQNWLSMKALPNDPSPASQQPRVGGSGSYVVSSTLTLPANTTLQGGATEFTQSDRVTALPPFQIVAANASKNGASWSGGTEVIDLLDFSRLSGVAVVADSDAQAGIDGVHVVGFHVVLDGHTSVLGGNVGVSAVSDYKHNNDPAAGLQIKDCQIIASGTYGLFIQMPNVRVIGNIVQGANVADLYYGGDEITIANNMIEDSKGDGVLLNSANMVKLIGNQLNDNGRGGGVCNLGSGAGYGLRVLGNSNNVMVTGNLFNKNCYSESGGQGGAHVFVDDTAGPITNLSFSGDVYTPSPNGKSDASTDYVFDAAGTASSLTGLQLYESPIDQVSGVYSSNALLVFGIVKPPVP